MRIDKTFSKSKNNAVKQKAALNIASYGAITALKRAETIEYGKARESISVTKPVKIAKPVVITPKRVKLELSKTNTLLSQSPMTASTDEQLMFADKANNQLVVNDVVIAAFDKEKAIDLTIANEQLKRLNMDSMFKPPLNGEYQKQPVDLNRNREYLKTLWSSQKEKLKARASMIRMLKRAIALEEQEIEEINKNKKQLYKDYKSSAFKAFSSDYPKTLHALRITKYIACSIPLLLALQYIDVNVLGNSDGFVKIALAFMLFFLSIAPLFLLACLLDENNEIKRPKNKKEFINFKCDKHSLYIGEINKQIQFEAESMLDIQEKIQSIRDELARRDAKVNTAISQVNHTKSTSNTREENKKKLELAILDTDYITGKLKRARSTQSILKLTDDARERIAANAIVLKASQAKMQKVELVTANDQLKELLASIESRLIEQMKQAE
ncbi:hypothetical protein L1887_51135 [Cichorium endivia]|nr:hypothetical protein L1887_51135 [Cichorium endivia]